MSIYGCFFKILYFQLRSIIEPYLSNPEYDRVHSFLQELVLKIPQYQRIAISDDKTFYILL